MSYLFSDYNSNRSLEGISNWKVDNAFNTKSMFQECQLITNLNRLSKWKVSNVTNMSHMSYCHSIVSYLGGHSN